MACLDPPTIAALRDGRLSPDALARAETHVGECGACHARLAQALGVDSVGLSMTVTGSLFALRVPAPELPSEDAQLGAGTVIGRYTVLNLAGRGGMGEVYAVYDAELDRKVALKLLRSSGAADEARAQARLLREAKAMAKLSHANVVTVHDAGTFQERVFVTMEFVEGVTLKDWLAQAARGRAEILAVFAAAGRGLAAAHAAGLVHRDFKPQNVMVASDGTVRVMDFGLAWQPGDDDERTGEAPPTGSGVDGDGSGTTSQPSGLKLTQTGAIVGTPAYMAPEQFLSKPTDARADQFSFCVTLYEALYGQRPFAGETFFALAKAVTTGAVGDAPAGARVPAWIRRVLLRGLQTRAARRYPSLPALLTALDTDPTRRARRLALGGVGVLGLVGVVMATRHMSATPPILCTGGAQDLAGVWEPRGAVAPRKDAIHRAFTATGKGYAEQAFVNASRFLDDYVDRWVGLYRGVCEATHVRGEQSAEVLDLRMTCLHERLANVVAVTDLLAHADGVVVQNAVSAVLSLPQLDRCNDVALLKAVVKPPEDPATRARVETLRGELAKFLALRDGGHCVEAELKAVPLIQAAKQTGYGPLLAETMNAAGAYYDECIPVRTGIARLREGFTAALASKHDEAATEAAILLASAYAEGRQDIPQARYWQEVAAGMLSRIGGHPLLEAWGQVSSGMVLSAEGRWTEALQAFETSRALKEKVLGKDNPDVAGSLNDLANALNGIGRHQQALDGLRRAHDVYARALGPDHVRCGVLLANEGETLNLLHRHGEALQVFQRAMDVFRRWGPDPLFTSFVLTGMGIAQLGEGHADQAVAPLEEALQIRTAKALDAESMGQTRFALARALWHRPAERPRARELALQARADFAQVDKPKTPLPDVQAWLQEPGRSTR